MVLIVYLANIWINRGPTNILAIKKDWIGERAEKNGQVTLKGVVPRGAEGYFLNSFVSARQGRGIRMLFEGHFTLKFKPVESSPNR